MRLNRKIRVLTLLLRDCSIFCLLKTASLCTQTYNFGDKKWFFFCGGTQPLHHTLPLHPYGASPLLTEILNTPLVAINSLHELFRSKTITKTWQLCRLSSSFSLSLVNAAVFVHKHSVHVRRYATQRRRNSITIAGGLEIQSNSPH